MNVSQAKELFRQLVKSHFGNYTVIWSHQSRTAKPNIPLVTIMLGNAKRHRSPNELYDTEETEGFYLTRIPFTLDLFTNGKDVIDDDTGQVVAREDTALDEMLLFANYLNSLDVTQWCNKNDVSIVIDGDAIQMTGIINDTTYEFRSRLVVNFYFTQETVGDNAGSPAVASQQN